MSNVFWAHSFDHYQTADINAMGWTVTASAGAVSYAIGDVGRNGTQGLQLSRDTNANANAIVSAVRSYAAAQTVTNGTAFYTDKLPPATSKRLIAHVLDGATSQLDFFLLPSGLIQVERNTVVLGMTTIPLMAATYYFLEFKTKIDNAVGTVDLFLTQDEFNATSILSLTAQDTQVSGNASSNAFGLVHQASDVNDISNQWFDDFYHTDSTDDVYPGPIGNIYVLEQRPNDNGVHQDLTPVGADVAFQAVNERLENGDVSYIKTETVNAQSSFPATQAPLDWDILSVLLTHISRVESGAHMVAPQWTIATVDYPGTGQAMTTSYAAYTQNYAVSPASGKKWLTTELNAAQLGEKVTA